MGLVRDSARYYAMELLTCDNKGDEGDVDGDVVDCTST